MTTRRTLLQAGLLGAGLSQVPFPATASAASASVSAGGSPDVADPRFTLAVIPDTQYLFDQDRGDSAPLVATMKYLLENRRSENIVFTAHLGDVVENALATEFAQVDPVFRLLDHHRAPYSVLAGNHDIDSRTDDRRGDSPYLRTFGLDRFRRMPTYGGTSPGGYNSWHIFRGGGRQWLLLAMDWRPSDQGFAWARQVIADHPRLPVILTTHDLVYADAGPAELSEHGKRVWEQLVDGNDQIFLTLNGHFWPSGRVVKQNAAGNDVHLHITNYQDRYYGGSGMIRLYHFDLARNVIDVETISPWILAKPVAQRTALEQGEIELTDDTNRFSVPIDFDQRFAGFAPIAVRPSRPAARLVVPGTVAYWRFDGSGTDRVVDHSGHGNHLTPVLLSSDGGPLPSDEHHPDQPGHGSWLFRGGKRPARGGYLRTADDAPLNALTFRKGYTIEAFVKLADGDHAWQGLLSRMGTGADAGKTGGDPSEPVVNLGFSGGLQAQWAVYPADRNDIWTNWGHEMRAGEWFHLAVVNNGRVSSMYIDSSPVLRNPATRSNGLTTTSEPWLLGANHYDRTIEQSFAGHLHDTRLVNRPLHPRDFLTA